MKSGLGCGIWLSTGWPSGLKGLEGTQETKGTEGTQETKGTKATTGAVGEGYQKLALLAQDNLVQHSLAIRAGRGEFA